MGGSGKPQIACGVRWGVFRLPAGGSDQPPERTGGLRRAAGAVSAPKHEASAAYACPMAFRRC
jgi:hypothetical protein